MGRQVRSGRRAAESREAARPGRGHVDDASTECGVDIVNALPSVSRADVQRVVKNWFNRNNRSVVIGKPMQEKKK